jgi:hypothetical protein
MATYLGENEAGHPCWEIEGLSYTGSVSTVGGGTPVIGRVYPAWCNQPDSRSQWVVLVRPGTSKILPKEFAELALWTHFLATAGRSGRSGAWTPVDLRRLKSIEAAFEDPDALVRVWENTLVFDVFGAGGFIALATFGEQYFSFEYPSYFAGDGPLVDLVLDASEDGNLFILGATSVEKVARATVTQEWTESLGSGPKPGGTAPYKPLALTLHLAASATLEGEEEPTGPLVVCLSSKPHDTLGRPSLYLHRLARATGDPVGDPIRLTQPADAPFHAGEIFPVVSTWSTAENTTFKPCYWDPTLLGTDPVEVVGPNTRYRFWRKPAWQQFSTTCFMPWAAIGDLISNQYSPPVFPASPAGTVDLASAVYLGTQDAEPGGDPPEVLVYPANVVMTISEGDIVVPRYAKPVSCLSGYKASTGARVLEIKGWTAEPVDGLYVRDFFTPLVIRRGVLSVITRRCKFLDVDVDFKKFEFELEDVLHFPEDPLGPYDTYRHTVGVMDGEGFGFEDVTARRARPCISSEDYLETFSLYTGDRLSSTMLQPIKIVSMAHRPGEFAGEDPGTILIWDGEEAVPHPFESRGTIPDSTDLWYRAPSLRPQAKFTSAGVDGDGVGADLMTNLLDQNARDWFVSGGFYYVDDADEPVTASYEEKFVAVEMNTTADAPLLFDKTNPVLSSGGNLLIFPPRTYSSVMYDGNDMVLEGAKRSFESSGTIDEDAGVSFAGGSVSNGWLHDVAMGSDWNKLKRWFYAFHRGEGGLAWRYEFTYDTSKALTLARPCCGDGKVYLYYHLGTGTGSRRLRILSEADGTQLDDYALTLESGLVPGTPRSLILSGQVSAVVTADSIFSVLPPA